MRYFFVFWTLLLAAREIGRAVELVLSSRGDCIFREGKEKSIDNCKSVVWR